MDVDGTAALGRWLHAFDLRRAQRVVEVPGGSAVLHDDFPSAHDHNKLSLLTDADGAAVAAAADDVLGGAGRGHRLVNLRTPDAERAAQGLLAAGYARSDELLMTLTLAPAKQRPDVEVVHLDLAARIRVAAQEWSGELPTADPDVWRQLGERAVTATSAATASLLAVLDADDVVARADVYVHDGVAQVEEVMTRESHRGRGLATALVLHGVDLARAAGAHTVFLVADVDDWPRRLYERLGFTDTGVLPAFGRGTDGT